MSTQIAEQVTCLVLEPGAGIRYMWAFDLMSPKARQAARESDYNLCLACLSMEYTSVEDVKDMERQIRCQEVK